MEYTIIRYLIRLYYKLTRTYKMKNSIFAVITTILLAVTSCIEDGFTTDKGDTLAFSTDTLSFDTVFTGDSHKTLPRIQPP